MDESLDESGLTPDFLPVCWERSETANGIPYYIDHKENKTHWEHPVIDQLFKEIDKLNEIRYAAYRTALKLRAVQAVTNLSKVHKNVLESALLEIGLSEDQNDNIASVAEIETLLAKLFNRVDSSQVSRHACETLIELTLGWILKCYDSGRSGSVNVRSLKVGLIALCSGTLDEKYSFLHSQVCDENQKLSCEQLTRLMQDILLLPQNVGEGGPFSVNSAQAAAKNCWESFGKQPDMKISEQDFMTWLKREPLGLVWLPTLHRVATAETVKHEAKCACCKAYPIVGFRYRCLKCLNTDLCQVCFWSQKTTRTHKITHPSKEYCLATTTGDDVRDFAKQMKNKITKKYRHRRYKKGYLTYNITDQRGPESTAPSTFDIVHDRVKSLSGRLNELEDGESEGDECSESQVPCPRRLRPEDSGREVLAEVEVHQPPPLPPPSDVHRAVLSELEKTEYLRAIADLKDENKKLNDEIVKMKQQMTMETERVTQVQEEMPLASGQGNVDDLVHIPVVSNVHTGITAGSTVQPASPTNIPAIVETNELLKARMEVEIAHNQKLEATLAELRKKMKAIHASVISSKASSTSELMDRGTYTSLTEDWSFMTGGEEEKLKDFNDKMLSVFSGGIADDMPMSEDSILQAAERVKIALTKMVTEIDLCAQHPSAL